MFFRIDLVDMPKTDIAQVTPSKVLQLNARYFNSSTEMDSIIKEFIEKKYLPKGASIKYIATHEWGHYISMGDLSNSKSEMHKLYRRTKEKDYVTINASKDVYEFVADAIACNINKLSCKESEKVVQYYLKEVML